MRSLHHGHRLSAKFSLSEHVWLEGVTILSTGLKTQRSVVGSRIFHTESIPIEAGGVYLQRIRFIIWSGEL